MQCLGWTDAHVMALSLLVHMLLGLQHSFRACRTQIPPGVYTPSCPGAPGLSSNPVRLRYEISSSWSGV